MQRGYPGSGDQTEDRTQQKAPLIADKVPPPQYLNFRGRNSQLLHGFPQGAVCRGLPRLHSSARKAGLSCLSDGGGPDLKEKMQTVRLLKQWAEHGVLVPGAQQRGHMAAVPAAQQL